jgi:hypothetical protein
MRWLLASTPGLRVRSPHLYNFSEDGVSLRRFAAHALSHREEVEPPPTHEEDTRAFLHRHFSKVTCLRFSIHLQVSFFVVAFHPLFSFEALQFC